MIRWKLKSCPRCHGDMFIGKEFYHVWYEQCLMCGYMSEFREVNKLEHVELRHRNRISSIPTKKEIGII